MQVHVIGTVAVPAGGVAGDVLTRTGTGTGTAWQAPTGGSGGTVDTEQVRDIIGGTLVAGANVTITPNDPGDVVTIAVSGLTKSTVGLGNVDDTSDANKPISTAVAAALGNKASTTDLAAKADVSALAAKADVSALAAKADDTVVVHKTGNETVAGVKTFSSAPVVPANSFGIDRISGLSTALYFDGRVYYNGSSWQTRASRVPAGWTGPVEYFQGIYLNAPLPTDRLTGDILTRRKAAV